jgi:hypothetical protein
VAAYYRYTSFDGRFVYRPCLGRFCLSIPGAAEHLPRRQKGA